MANNFAMVVRDQGYMVGHVRAQRVDDVCLGAGAEGGDVDGANPLNVLRFFAANSHADHRILSLSDVQRAVYARIMCPFVDGIAGRS